MIVRSQLPALSEAHRGKHAGIRRLLVCPTRIEVSAVYTDLNAYLEAEQWFTWLREELSAQLIRWDEIGPPNAIALPSVGSIEARLEGQITLDVAARPRFEVDREKMIELVQGANIYDGPEDGGSHRLLIHVILMLMVVLPTNASCRSADADRAVRILVPDLVVTVVDDEFSVVLARLVATDVDRVRLGAVRAARSRIAFFLYVPPLVSLS
jgi:hypothetical protein